MRMQRGVLCLAALVVLAALLAGVVQAPVFAGANGNPNPRVIPANAQVADQSGVPLTYADWADRYNQWLLSIPRSVDLLANPGLGQDPASPVFFLPSASGGGAPPFTLEGPTTVPGGKVLLLPVTWAFAAGALSLDCCWLTAEQARACMPALADQMLDSMLAPEMIGELYASVDGHSLQALPEYRVHSAVPFAVSMPADNIFTPMGVPCGEGEFTGLAISDGYWLMLTPLSPGQHTITFGSDVLHTTLRVTVPS